MPPQAYALVTLFILCSAALGWVAARLVLGLDERMVYDAAAFYGSGAPVDRFIVQYLEVFQKLAHA